MANACAQDRGEPAAGSPSILLRVVRHYFLISVACNFWIFSSSALTLFSRMVIRSLSLLSTFGLLVTCEMRENDSNPHNKHIAAFGHCLRIPLCTANPANPNNATVGIIGTSMTCCSFFFYVERPFSCVRVPLGTRIACRGWFGAKLICEFEGATSWDSVNSERPNR